MRVESGPASGDRNYWLLVTAACLAFTGWFFYDGQYGWPAKNRAEAAKRLSVLCNFDSSKVTTLNPRPTKEDYEELVRAGLDSPAAIRDKLGVEPICEREQNPGETVQYYASSYGVITVPVRLGKVMSGSLQWTTWYKNRDEIRSQYYWAVVPLLLGMYALYRLVGALTLRVVVDSDGVTYGKQLIPLGAITALRDYNRKGWVDLYYRKGDTEQRLRLDDHKIDRFSEIVQAICAAKGFENPLNASSLEPEEEDPSPTSHTDSSS